ncbi:MAG: hypothetical protein V7K26_17335 [Nostoc sp.]|uniref:hypothetical protein n=1 Tax=Nostoc sp. TaxID=1180 RepID=UPI002FF34B75
MCCGRNSKRSRLCNICNSTLTFPLTLLYPVLRTAMDAPTPAFLMPVRVASPLGEGL